MSANPPALDQSFGRQRVALLQAGRAAKVGAGETAATA
jgi:hypothetical protein